MLLERI
ncbi:hypothetical protein LINPERPRIM_LOCUS10918 [Linum perenne]